MSHAFTYFLSLIAARSVVVLLALIAGLRFLGKRQLGQMNIYDLALIMALANSIQNAMTHGNGNLSVGLVSAGSLLLVSWALTLLVVRLPKLETRLVGTPTVLLNDGHIQEDAMRRECVTQEELSAVLRQHGLTDPREAMLAVLEVDGSISIVPKTASHRRATRHFKYKKHE